MNNSLLGYNQFAYCENNPVIYADYYGQDLGLAAELFLGVAFVAVVSISVLFISNLRNSPNRERTIQGLGKELKNAANDFANGIKIGFDYIAGGIEKLFSIGKTKEDTDKSNKGGMTYYHVTSVFPGPIKVWDVKIER